MAGMKCGVCEEKVYSDAAVKEYCTSCGMGLAGDFMVGEAGLAFCGRNCLEAFYSRGGLNEA